MDATPSSENFGEQTGLRARVNIRYAVRYIYVQTYSTGGEGDDGNEEQLLVRNAPAALLLPVHGAARAAVVVNLCRRRRRRAVGHFR